MLRFVLKIFLTIPKSLRIKKDQGLIDPYKIGDLAVTRRSILERHYDLQVRFVDDIALIMRIYGGGE